jgi:hypothetical protein
MDGQSIKIGDRVKWTCRGSGEKLGGIVTWLDKWVHVETAPYKRRYGLEFAQVELTDEVIEVTTESPEVIAIQAAFKQSGLRGCD